MSISQSSEQTLQIVRYGYCGVLLITPTFLHLVIILLKKDYRIVELLLYSSVFPFLILSLTEKVFTSTKVMFGELYYAQGNQIYLISFLCWLLYIFIAQILIYKCYAKSYPKPEKRISIFLYSFAFFLQLGSMNFLPAFGIKIYPFGNFLLPIYALIATYAILKHQFLDINVLIKRSLVYSVVITFISIFYLLVIMILEKVLQNLVGYKSILLSGGTTFLLGLAIIPLKNMIQNFIDRLFFQGTHNEIIEQNTLLKQEVVQSAKLKAIATLASGMAHEIKNPLTAIKTFTEFLPQKLEDKDFLIKFSKIVGDEVNRIDNLVHELLSFSKPNQLNLSKQEIHKLVDDTLLFLNNDFIKHRIQIHTTYHNESLYIEADKNQLKQALLNILLNSIEALHNGGDIYINTTLTSNKVILSIKDTGVGISQEDLPHIFDPFYSKKDQGTGLGLSITYGIITDHRGKIKVKSQISHGTEILVELPL